MLKKFMRFLYNEVLDIFSPLVFLIAGFIMTVKFLSSTNELSTGNGAFLGFGIMCIAICFIIVVKLVKYIFGRFFKVDDFSFMNIIAPFIILLIALFNSSKMNLLYEKSFALLLVLSLMPIIITAINLMNKRNYNRLFIIAFFMIVAKFIYTIFVIFKMPNLIAYIKMDAPYILLEIFSDIQFLFFILAIIYLKQYKAVMLKFGSFFAGVMAVVISVFYIKSNYAFILSGELDILQLSMRLLEPLSSILIAVIMIYIFFYIYNGERLYFRNLKYLMIAPSVLWILQSIYNAINNVQLVMPKAVITFVVCVALFVFANYKKEFSDTLATHKSEDLKVSENTPG